jgi:hypothetical protein
MRMFFDPLAILDFFTLDHWAPNLCSLSFGSGGSSKQSSKSGTKYNTGFLNSFYNDFPMVNYDNEADGVSVNNLEPNWLSGSGAVNGKQVAVLDDQGNPRFNEDGSPMMEAKQAGKQNKNVLNSSFPRQQFTVGIPKFKGLEDMDFDKLQSSLYNRQLQNLNPTYETERARRREELSQTGLLNSPVAFAEGGALDSLERNYMDQNQKAASDAAIQTVGLKQEELARKLGFDQDMVKLIEAIMQQRAAVALQSGQSSKGSGSSDGGFSFGFLS